MSVIAISRSTNSGTMRRVAKPYDHGQPIASLSLAPLAGIILVIVLVLAALRPPVTHAVLVDLPYPNPEMDIRVLSPPSNRLSIDAAGSIAWNSQIVSPAELDRVLKHTLSENPQPTLQFEPAANAPFAKVLSVMEQVRTAGLIDHCFRFAGIARYRRYEQAPDPNELLTGELRECDIAYY